MMILTHDMSKYSSTLLLKLTTRHSIRESKLKPVPNHSNEARILPTSKQVGETLSPFMLLKRKCGVQTIAMVYRMPH